MWEMMNKLTCNQLVVLHRMQTNEDLINFTRSTFAHVLSHPSNQPRWPYRKLRSLDTMIEGIKRHSAHEPDNAAIQVCVLAMYMAGWDCHEASCVLHASQAQWMI